MGLCATIALAEPRLAGKAQLPTAIRITGAVDVFQTLRIPWINCVSGRSDFGRPRGAKPSGASPIAVTPRYGWLVCTARRRSPGIANRLKSVLNGEQAPEPRSFTGYWASFAFRTVVISLIVGIAIGLIGGTPSAWRTC